MKVIVAGGRTFTDALLLDCVLSKLIRSDWEIVSGGARGADRMGKVWANEHNVSCRVFPAKWDLLGKRAGMVRNGEMADYADALVAFWDGISVGTKNMIESMTAVGKQVRVIRY